MSLLLAGINIDGRPPVEYADAVTLYYRNKGRNARLVRLKYPKVWAVRIEPRSDDPRLGAWREGRLEQYPAEQIELVECKKDAHTVRSGHRSWTVPGYVGYDLEELGVSGLIEFLDQADVLSGRGEVSSLAEAVRIQRENQKRMQEKARAEAKDAALEIAKSKRRSVLGIPFLPVGINLKRPANTPAEES